MPCLARVCCVLALIVHLVSAQEAKHCRFVTEYDTKGDAAGRSERLLNQDISECETLCLSEASCVAVEFEALTSTCFSYSADTSKTLAKGVTFLTKVCLTHDSVSTESPDVSASSVAGLDAADSTTPEIPIAESTASLLDALTTVAEPGSSTTDSPLVNTTDSVNVTGSTASVSDLDLASSIDSSMSPDSAAALSSSEAPAVIGTDSLTALASISVSQAASSSVDITPTSTLEAMTHSTAVMAGVTTPALVPSPTTIVTTQKTTTKADIPVKPVKTSDPPAVDRKPPITDRKPPVTDAKPPVTDANPSVIDANPSVIDAKQTINSQPPAVGSFPNQGIPPNGSYPYPYPPPYPYPMYPPYPYMQYPPYPQYPPGYPPYAQYPNPYQPQPQPQPQIPIYQLPKSTDPPVTLNKRTNRLCFNRNKFPDLKLPEEKPKFFLIPSGGDGKFSVVSVPSRYNPVVCFPVSYRGNVPILHLPSTNPQSPYNTQPQQQNPLPFPFPGQSAQIQGGQNYYQNQDGTVGVPIDISKFLKEYGQGDVATTSPQTTVAAATPTTQVVDPDTTLNGTDAASNITTDTSLNGTDAASNITTDTSLNGTDAASNITTDIGSDTSNSSLPDAFINGTAENNMPSLNGSDIDTNVTNDFNSNSTNNAMDNSTVHMLNDTESGGNQTSFNSSFVDSNTTDIFQNNVNDATTPSTTISTIITTTLATTKAYGGPGPLRNRWSKRKRRPSRRDKKRRRRPRPRTDRYKAKHPSRFAQRHYLRRKKLDSRRSRVPQGRASRTDRLSSRRLRELIDKRAEKLQ